MTAPILHTATALLLLTVAGGLPSPLAASPIYQCSAADGTPLFSQYPCAGTKEGGVIEVAPTSVVAAPELTEAERATLDRIRTDSTRIRQAAARNLRRARRRDARLRLESAAVCTAAKKALDDLRQRKRKGYSLAEAVRLSTEEARLRARINENC